MSGKEFEDAAAAAYAIGIYSMRDRLVEMPPFKVDQLMARRLSVYPEGSHLLTLTASFLVDVSLSILGGLVLAQPELKVAVARLRGDIATVRDPVCVTVHALEPYTA
eukprot:1285472-Amphidinium_carterae.1